MKQHQTETRATLSFISTYQLQDACLAIQGDLAKTNAVSLASDARREALSILERWLNQHLFHAGISREASGPTSSKLVVETLADYPAMNTMGFILAQLQEHLGIAHVPNEFLHLPPFNLFIHVAQLFLTGVLSAELPSDDGGAALCKKLIDIVQLYERLMHHLRMESVIWDALFKQYEHQRDAVGRALFTANIPNQAVPVNDLVTNDLKRRNLMDALDQMEERRLLLVRLVEFAFDGGIETALHQKINRLESKRHLFKHYVAFDAVVHRVQTLVLNQMLSSNVLEQLRESQMQLHALYHRLQKQLQTIATAHHVDYEGIAHIPKLDAPNLIVHDAALSNISTARQQRLSAFEERVDALARDLGISLDKTLDLIHDLADYLQRLPETTKKSALILFGSTGVGKSTLFNFLTGCLYQEEINEEDGNAFREKISGVELSEVGHGERSKTTFPVIADLPDKPYALIDMPGSTDNRGKKDASMMSPYDLSAAVSMKYVIKRFDTIKGILVVCPDEQLTPERPPLELQEVFQQVGRMVMDKPHLSENILLGITKQGRRTLKQVLGRLRNIAKAFTDDKAMSAFLNAFIQDPDVEGRLLFMDVISEPERGCYFDRFDEKLIPQPTKEYHFEEYSHRLDKLHRLLNQLSESRQQLHQERVERQFELDVITSLEETQRRNVTIEATIPQWLPIDSHDLSLDELAQLQNQLRCFCEQITQLNSLLHQVHRVEEALAHKKELSQQLEQLQCQEEIEFDFHQRLGLLCAYQEEPLSASSSVSIRGTLFNPTGSKVHQHSASHSSQHMIRNSNCDR